MSFAKLSRALRGVSTRSRTPSIYKPSLRNITTIPLAAPASVAQHSCSTGSNVDNTAIPPVTAEYEGKDKFWQKIPMWEDVSTEEFLSDRWSRRHTVQGNEKLRGFLESTLPQQIPVGYGESQPKKELVEDIFAGITASTMAIRLTPYILSRIDWSNPRTDPVFRQFVPLGSVLEPDHPKLTLDSLQEEKDSPVPGLVHRYPDKALFLPISVCPTYCMFCTRSYAVGADTDTVVKHSLKPTRKRWDAAFEYIARTPRLCDIVVSGGDSYYLEPEHLFQIGSRLIELPNIRRFRFASKALAVCPGRILDEDDRWFKALRAVSNKGREAGKNVALHTHFNHPQEFSWVTEMAAQKLFENGIIVRNQSVLLRGVNDNVDTMGELIRKLADNNVFPYYVYLCDMVSKSEHLRTPLSTILYIESQLRGFIAGYMMPQFVVDLPGGGGKRIASTFDKYDRLTGESTFCAPAVKGGQAKYTYWDPLHSLNDEGKAEILMFKDNEPKTHVLPGD